MQAPMVRQVEGPRACSGNGGTFYHPPTSTILVAVLPFPETEADDHG